MVNIKMRTTKNKIENFGDGIVDLKQLQIDRKMDDLTPCLVQRGLSEGTNLLTHF